MMSNKPEFIRLTEKYSRYGSWCAAYGDAGVDALNRAFDAQRERGKEPDPTEDEQLLVLDGFRAGYEFAFRSLLQ